MSRKQKKKNSKPGQIDLTAALAAPVKLKQDGEVRTVHPQEAILRQHVKKALSLGTVSSLRFLFDEAEKHDLIKQPPAPVQGGAFVVPKGLPEEVEQAIFDYQPEGEEKDTMSRIWGLILPYLKLLRSQRNDNG